jgi:hypothetical protein
VFSLESCLALCAARPKLGLIFPFFGCIVRVACVGTRRTRTEFLELLLTRFFQTVVLRSDFHPKLLLAACVLIFPWLVHCPARFGFVQAACGRELKPVLVLAGWSGSCGSVLSFLVLTVCV